MEVEWRMKYLLTEWMQPHTTEMREEHGDTRENGPRNGKCNTGRMGECGEWMYPPPPGEVELIVRISDMVTSPHHYLPEQIVSQSNEW